MVACFLYTGGVAQLVPRACLALASMSGQPTADDDWPPLPQLSSIDDNAYE